MAFSSAQVCDDEVGSYMTSAVFPGLGLLLSLDRLTSLAKEERTPHFGSIDASPLSHQRSENMELGVTWPRCSIGVFPLVQFPLRVI